MSLQEKLFFPGVREGLNTALGISSLEELKQRDQITLAPVILELVQQDVEKTLQNHREHAARFGFRKGSLIVTSEDVGSEIDLLKQTAESQDVKWWRVHFGIGRPDVVDLHTHPSVTHDYLLNELGRDRHFKSRKQEIQHSLTRLGMMMLLDVNLANFNLAAPNFSAGDLATSRSFPRLGAASLLGSEYGYRLIVNPNFKIALRRSRTKEVRRYEKEYDELLQKEVEKMQQERRKTFDVKAFQSKVDILLKKVCDKEGWLLFGNDDYNSPVLNRL